MYQSATISTYFKTEGYLISIASVLAVAILPRERFIQLLILNILSICLASAMSLLLMWSSIQARAHTSPPPATGYRPPYNSSQSAVCAVWLFTNIWLANFLRAKLPSLNLPVVLYSIIVNTSATVGPTIATTKMAESFVRELLLAMLFGMGLATAVSLFVVPISGRSVVIAELKSLNILLRETVNLQKDYFEARMPDGAPRWEQLNEGDVSTGLWKRRPSAMRAARHESPDDSSDIEFVKRIRETIRALRNLVGKLWNDIPVARRSIAWGHLGSEDLEEVYRLFGNVTIPM